MEIKTPQRQRTHLQPDRRRELQVARWEDVSGCQGALWTIGLDLIIWRCATHWRGAWYELRRKATKTERQKNQVWQRRMWQPKRFWEAGRSLSRVVSVEKAQKGKLLPQSPREVELSAKVKTNFPNIDPFIVCVQAPWSSVPPQLK